MSKEIAVGISEYFIYGYVAGFLVMWLLNALFALRFPSVSFDIHRVLVTGMFNGLLFAVLSSLLWLAQL